MGKHEGRVAAVTGGTSGIGRLLSTVLIAALIGGETGRGYSWAPVAFIDQSVEK
jgi:hypothetical protein